MTRISTKTHGTLDYITGATMTALPHMLGSTTAASRLLETAGAGAAAYSMMTDYERGLVRALPMQAHLALDIMSGVTLATFGMMMNEEKPQTRAALIGLGLFEIATAMMTEPEPADKRHGRRRRRQTFAGRLADYVS